jgi:hypothetical protein
MSDQLKKLFDGPPRPLTESEAKELIDNTFVEINAGGMWGKLCAECGQGIGGRLAKYGKPTSEDLQYCACPMCGAVGKVRLEYIPPRSERP